MIGNLSYSTLLTCLLLLAPLIHADQGTVIMGTSDGPPYMIQATESGLDIEIPRAALASVGIHLELKFYPLARALHELKNDRIQLTAPFFMSAPEGIFVSDSHIEYRPSVITLNNIPKLNNILSLKDYSIATFQGARGYFGPDFISASKTSHDYQEHHDMSKLVDMLMAQHYQVIVLDYWIFRHFLSKSQYKDDIDKVTFHELIPKVPAVVAFTDSKLRDQFNRGLHQIKKDGTYQKIINRYLRY